MSNCPQDAAFGPASACRSFDFTLTFEAAILSILPLSLFIPLCLFLLYRLRNAPRVVNPFRYLPQLGKQLLVWQMGVASAGLVCDSIALAAWASSGMDQAGSATVLASLAVRVVASAVTVPLVYLEFFRRFSASPLLPLSLTITTLCDSARVRTFTFPTFRGLHLFYGSYVAAFALRAALWVLETAPKDRFVERAEGDKVITAEETSSFFARLLITSVDPVLVRGFRTKMTIQSLGAIHSSYDAERLYELGYPDWEKHLTSGKTKRPLLRAMFSAFGSTLLAPILPCIIYSLAQATAPTLVSGVLHFIESYQTGNAEDRQPAANGWGLVGAYGLVFLISALSWSLFQMSALRSSVAVRGFLVQMVYRKALRIHTDVAKEIGTGSSTSLMSVDVERIVNQMEAIHLLYSSFIIVVVGLVILYYTVGASFVATIIVAVAFMASIPILTKTIPAKQKRWSGQTDLRVKLVGSILKNIKAVKLSGYEEILIKKLDSIRLTEVTYQGYYYKALIIVSWLTNMLKSMLSMATLTTYTIVSMHSSSHTVNTTTFFTTISVLGVVTDPLLIVGQRYAGIMAATASLTRIQEFLLRPEKEDSRTDNPDIEAEGASFGNKEITLLKNVTFTLPTKGLTMVVGSVGSGKSSLLHGLIGELDLLTGCLKFPRNASVGFCAQDAWIRPGETVRQNIQFLGAFSPALYRAVVKACGLDVDFRIWPQGDKQKAQGLSGGQKQRIALARALYSRPDILVLDDVFSALDKQTEEHVFQSLFGANGLLVDRTVILATNAVHRLPRADHIMVIDDNTVVQQGNYDDLAKAEGAVRQLLSLVDPKSVEDVERNGQGTPADDAASSYIMSLAQNVDDIEAEMAAETSKKSPFLTFCTGGGLFSFLFALLLGFVFSCLPGIIPVYVQAWTTAVQHDQHRMYSYLGGYIAVEVAYAIMFVIALSYMFFVYAQSMSLTIHAAEIRSLMRTSLSYFDDKPFGRLLSRFSQDLFICDFELVNHFNNFYGLSVEMATAAVILIIAAPYVGIVLLFTFILCITLQRFYVRTSRQVRRMDFIAKSPLYTLFAETIDANGLKTIRAVRGEDELARLAILKGNTSQIPFYIMNAIKKWLNMVLGLVVTLINVFLVMIAVLTRETTSAGVLAVALVQATSLMLLLNLVILSAADFETALVAVSRIQETIELPREESEGPDGAANNERGGKDHLELKNKKVENDWITAGSVRFQNVVLKYREDLPPALKNVTFKVPGGKKIGIVGRSGCGKSTALNALFRMHELESGTIFIDGVDITTLPRAMLRNAMTIIPQDPLMLELSVRDNLDVEGTCTDQDIWAALEKAQCKTLIEGLPDKLETLVTGDGGDFSRGERQLLALARGLLRNRKILVLDEASSSLDVETDTIVQQVLRSAFNDCTIISVAHRLTTLLDYDSIVVLHQGEIVEQGNPQTLLQRQDGPFSQLLRGDQGSVPVFEQEDTIREL